MMEAKDWLSFFIGAVIFAAGLIPILSRYNIISWNIPMTLSLVVLQYIIAIGGLYLAINSLIEITNSNPVGWISLLISFVMLAAGLIPILVSFNVFGFSLPFLSEAIYQILFVIEGFFLMIACFAMEM